MELNGIPRAFLPKTCIANFHQQHFDQVRPHRYLHYREFKKKVIATFKRHDMSQYKIKELWTIKLLEEEAPDQFMTRIRVLAREAFKKLADEEQQTLAVHAFCEGLKDRNVATMVATQARNSAARAVRIAAEAIAVNSKVIDAKRQSRQSRTSKKAMVGVSSSHAGAHDYSQDVSDSPVESEQSRSSVHSESENSDCIVGASGKDARGRWRRNFRGNQKGMGSRRSASQDGTIRC